MIRPFDHTDIEACANIYMRARQYAFHWLPSMWFQCQDFIQDTTGEDVWVTEESGTIKGFVSLQVRRRFVHTLFVDPAWHGQGVGSALLEHALRQLEQQATLICVLGNLRARQFYEKRGWRPIRAGRDHLGPWIKYLYVAPTRTPE